jgi:hypothetical protein
VTSAHHAFKREGIFGIKCIWQLMNLPETKSLKQHKQLFVSAKEIIKYGQLIQHRETEVDSAVQQKVLAKYVDHAPLFFGLIRSILCRLDYSSVLSQLKVDFIDLLIDTFKLIDQSLLCLS